jgi:hypothetical protein
MKQFFFILSAVLISINISAQHLVYSTASIDQAAQALKTKTYVVLLEQEQLEKTNVIYEKIQTETVVESGKKADLSEFEDNEFNKQLKFGMKTFWKATKFEFIKAEEFEQKRMDPASSFIFLYNMKTKYKEEKTYVNYLVFALGGKAKRIDKMPWVAAVPLSYGNVGPEYYTYKIAGLIQFLQNLADYVANNPNQTKESIEKYFNKRNKEVKDYKLYVLADDLTKSVYTNEQIEKYYQGEVVIVDQKQIEEAIKKQDPNVAYVHKAGPERTKSELAFNVKMILTAKGGECLYIREDEIWKKEPEGMLEKDFKALKK